LDDVLCAHFLMVVEPDWMPTERDLALAAETGVTFASLGREGKAGNEAIIEPDGIIQKWLEDHGACAALVRPDHVVFGTSSGNGGETQLLERLHAKLKYHEASVSDASDEQPSAQARA
jgi:3-(3-hydroxy-phenyl)propionate hydroxylase